MATCISLFLWLFCFGSGTFRLTPVKAISLWAILKFRPINHVAPQHSWLAYHLLRGCESIECFPVIPFFNASLDTEELSCGLWLHNESPH